MANLISLKAGQKCPGCNAVWRAVPVKDGRPTVAIEHRADCTINPGGADEEEEEFPDET